MKKFELSVNVLSLPPFTLLSRLEEVYTVSQDDQHLHQLSRHANKVSMIGGEPVVLRVVFCWKKMTREMCA